MDDELIRFEAEGLWLPEPVRGAFVDHDGARIWYASFGSGPPLVLLHGGLGHSGNWGSQVPAFLEKGYRVVVIDSRGHGRSTRDSRPYTYELMGSDVLAVLNALGIEKAAFVGWSDGACTALILAAKVPARVDRVVYFACNMDDTGTLPFVFTPILGRCIARHQADYRRLSATPDAFQEFSDAVGLMQRTQPNYSAQELHAIEVPVLVVHSEFDEFIQREHAEYLARTLPQARFVLLEGVSHFAPLQRPELFNGVVLDFLGMNSYR